MAENSSEQHTAAVQSEPGSSSPRQGGETSHREAALRPPRAEGHEEREEGVGAGSAQAPGGERGGREAVPQPAASTASAAAEASEENSSADAAAHMATEAGAETRSTTDGTQPQQQSQQQRDDGSDEPEDNDGPTLAEAEQQQQAGGDRTAVGDSDPDQGSSQLPSSSSSAMQNSAEAAAVRERNALRGHDDQGRWRVRFFAEADDEWADRFTGYVDVQLPHLIIEAEDDRES